MFTTLSLSLLEIYQEFPLLFMSWNFPQLILSAFSILLRGYLLLNFQEKNIKIFNNLSLLDLFHKIVVANHAILRKFWTPKNLSEEGFQLFSCLAWPSEDKNKYWYYYHQSVQTPLDCLIFVSWAWIPNFSILGYV